MIFDDVFTFTKDPTTVPKCTDSDYRGRPHFLGVLLSTDYDKDAGVGSVRSKKLSWDDVREKITVKQTLLV